MDHRRFMQDTTSKLGWSESDLARMIWAETVLLTDPSPALDVQGETTDPSSALTGKAAERS